MKGKGNMRKFTLRSTLRNLTLAFALGAVALLPLALASCANSKEKDKTEESHEGMDMPKGDGHKDHQH